MRARITQNFRGARALVLHAADDNSASLIATLGRLGLSVESRDLTAPCAVPAELDVVFFDADHGLGNVFGDDAAPDVPLIALIGIEAPSRLTRVVRQSAAAYIMKPVRASGVYTALVVGFHEHSRRRQETEGREALSRRVMARREIVKAVVSIMQIQGVDDEEAFRRLRRESMRRRIAIEDLAREIVDESSERIAGLPGDWRPVKRKLQDR